jgi:hypothetical protein
VSLVVICAAAAFAIIGSFVLFLRRRFLVPSACRGSLPLIATGEPTA